MSNRLDPDQADVLSGLIRVQNVCKGYQQTTLGGKELTLDLIGLVFFFLEISCLIERLFLVWFFTSQSTAIVISRRPVNLTTLFPRQARSSG